MGLEPAFSQDIVSWPLAGPFVLPPEPNDPDVTIPNGSLNFSLRDTPEKIYIGDANSELTAMPAEPLGVRRPGRPRRKWRAAVVLSCVLHAAAAIALAAGDEPALIEGADQSGIMLLGNAPEDQSAAGDMPEAPPEATKVTLIAMLAPKPVQTVEAQPVAATDLTQPVETTEAEASAMATLEPLRETPDRPTSALDSVDPVPDEPATATSVEPLPEILAVDSLQPVDDDNSVQKPAPQSTMTVEASERNSRESEGCRGRSNGPRPRRSRNRRLWKGGPSLRTRGKPSLGKSRSQKRRSPKPRRRRKRRLRSRARSRLAPAARTKPTQSAASPKARPKAMTATRSQGGGSGIGNASASNYPGKVAAKLRRASRGISGSALAKARNDVQVSFTVDANGAVGGVRIARSSGSPELDQAALAIIRRAAPFPPIPADAGRSSWTFSLPLGLAR